MGDLINDSKMAISENKKNILDNVYDSSHVNVFLHEFM